MYLTRHQTGAGPLWAVNGHFLPPAFTLGLLLEVPAATVPGLLRALPTGAPVGDAQLLPPVEPAFEVWASGVTFLRSREARKAESVIAEMYEKIYDAERPELFITGTGMRTVGDGMNIRIRRDSTWDAPEPELVLVLNARGEIVGYSAGNDMTSRSIEGENPLYLAQAKIYDGSCAVGPGIRLATADELRDLPIELEVVREGAPVFRGETRTSQMRRPFEELAEWLYRELSFPFGTFLMTGTGIVPPDDFALQVGDVVRVRVGELTLTNEVAQ